MNIGTTITLATLGASALAGAGIWWYLRREGRAQSEDTKVREKDLPGQPAPLRQWLGVQTVRDGVIVLDTPGTYAGVARLAAPDIALLGIAEQEALETALVAAMRGVRFPVQLIAVSEAVDTRALVAQSMAHVTGLPPALAELATRRAEYLEAVFAHQGAQARTAYIATQVSTAKGLAAARAELDARWHSLGTALRGVRVELRPLGSAAILDLLAHMLRPGSAWRPSVGIEKGVLCDFHVQARAARETA
ncbi:hypothetical protein [Desulfurispora thermophila]|uniref:hypothetical protein n=1 Tax=Desulfurispora thermophila TaxID=265470 RepID=UPI00036F2698|nr:hypothetical protein [Desulfurispora thermophila]